MEGQKRVTTSSRKKSSAQQSRKRSSINHTRSRKTTATPRQTKQKSGAGVKWRTLKHNGPLFPAPYCRLPKFVHFYYNGRRQRLARESEEVAVFFAKMLHNKNTKDSVFKRNFFKDWRKVMTPGERKTIVNFSKCDFTEIHRHFKRESDRKRKTGTSKAKRDKERQEEKYGYCKVDGRKQKIGNYKIEPPGLFCGRGNHPKRGMIKGRVTARDVIINCGKRAEPRPPGRGRWKEVRHDQSVTWLASWTDNIQGTTKYINLDVTATLKSSADKEKYDKARQLHKHIAAIRRDYMRDLDSQSLMLRQRGVALYLIDRLLLRAGNEKDSDTADTVGCCTLRVEHVQLRRLYKKLSRVVEFDFLGKDSIRYQNMVSVSAKVFRNLGEFMKTKKKNEALFDRLTTASLNTHLHGLMDGLSAKVFRTYKASVTLQSELKRRTRARDSVEDKLCAYREANREVAILCNHKRATPKNFDAQMKRLGERIEDLREALETAEEQVDEAKALHQEKKTEATKKRVEQRRKRVMQMRKRLNGLERQRIERNKNKDIALGTSKLNYLDPRISVAWCRKWSIPVEKIYNKRQRDRFSWAIQSTRADYKFI